jgi:hypothetical protein
VERAARRRGSAGNSISVSSSSASIEVVRWVTKKSRQPIVRVPRLDDTCMRASSAAQVTGSSAAGSA